MKKIEDLNLKKLGFGAMRLPIIKEDKEDIDFNLLNKMIDYSMEHGVNYFDTAWPYHGGKSELALKKCLVDRFSRDTFYLANKMPVRFIKKAGEYDVYFKAQLERCGVDYFDFYLLHNIGKDAYKIIQEHDGFGYLQKLKKENKAKFIGFSFHDTAEVLDEILTDHPNIDFVQLQINYADWDNPVIQSRKCYEVATKHNIPVIVMEPIKGGSLANPIPEIKELFVKENPNLSIASWAIRFAASLDNVFLVLSGMSNLEHVHDNISYMKDFKPLTLREKETIDKVVKILAKSLAIGCTDCKYCVDGCPQKINIPRLFGTYNEAVQYKNMFIQKMYYNRITFSGGKASTCIACNQCERHCPQHLPIVKHLKEVAKLLETE